MLRFEHHVFIHHVSDPDTTAEKILGLLTKLDRKVTTMATKQEALDAVTRERQQIVDAFATANAAQDEKTRALEARVKELQDKIDAGEAVTAAEMAELVTAIEGIYNPPEPELPDPVVTG